MAFLSFHFPVMKPDFDMIEMAFPFRQMALACISLFSFFWKSPSGIANPVLVKMGTPTAPFFDHFPNRITHFLLDLGRHKLAFPLENPFLLCACPLFFSKFNFVVTKKQVFLIELLRFAVSKIKLATKSTWQALQ